MVWASARMSMYCGCVSSRTRVHCTGSILQIRRAQRVCRYILSCARLCAITALAKKRSLWRHERLVVSSAGKKNCQHNPNVTNSWLQNACIQRSSVKLLRQSSHMASVPPDTLILKSSASLLFLWWGVRPFPTAAATLAARIAERRAWVDMDEPS